MMTSVGFHIFKVKFFQVVAITLTQHEVSSLSHLKLTWYANLNPGTPTLLTRDHLSHATPVTARPAFPYP